MVEGSETAPEVIVERKSLRLTVPSNPAEKLSPEVNSTEKTPSPSPSGPLKIEGSSVNSVEKRKFCCRVVLFNGFVIDQFRLKPVIVKSSPCGGFGIGDQVVPGLLPIDTLTRDIEEGFTVPDSESPCNATNAMNCCNTAGVPLK